MSDKLENCPFCGYEGKIDYHNHSNTYGVECSWWNCPSKARRFKEEEAIACWNTRAYLKELKSCNDEYEALETESHEMQLEIERLQSQVSDIELSAISLVTSEHLRLTDSTKWLYIGMENIQKIVEFSLKAFLKARMNSW